MPTLADLRQKLGDVFIDTYFEYAVNMGGAAFVTGLETLSNVIPIQSDAHFICTQTKLVNSAELATGLAATPNIPVLLNGGVLVQLFAGQTGAALSNIPVPANSIFGTAQRPYFWPIPFMFRANTPITLNITGQGVGPPTVIGVTFRFVFGGYKVPRGSFKGRDDL